MFISSLNYDSTVLHTYDCTNFKYFPQELMFTIFSNFNVHELATVYSVSRRFHFTAQTILNQRGSELLLTIHQVKTAVQEKTELLPYEVDSQKDPNRASASIALLLNISKNCTLKVSSSSDLYSQSFSIKESIGKITDVKLRMRYAMEFCYVKWPDFLNAPSTPWCVKAPLRDYSIETLRDVGQMILKEENPPVDPYILYDFVQRSGLFDYQAKDELFFSWGTSYYKRGCFSEAEDVGDKIRVEYRRSLFFSNMACCLGREAVQPIIKKITDPELRQYWIKSNS